MYPCDRCQRNFNTSKGMLMHIKSIHEGVRYHCHICNKIYMQEWNLKQHIKLHTEPNPAAKRNLSFPYNDCSMVFKSNNGRYRHIQSIHLKQMYYCNLCENVYTNTASLNRHIRVHTGELPYNCPKCDKSFVGKSDLRGHLVCHVSQTEKSHVCNICDKRFADSKRLKLHLVCHTGEKHYKCQQCGKTFVNSGHLKRHGAVHTDDKPYPCDKCSARFGNSDNLRTHMRTHENFSKKCPHCKKTFRSYGGYNQHLRREHPAEGVQKRIYNCVFCGRNFNQSPNLHYHIRSHIGERPEECDLCDMQFVDKGAKFAHMRCRHTNEKSYSCDVCGKSFAFNRDLKRHQRTHSRPQKPFSCSFCGKRYSSQRSLHMHNKICRSK